MWVRRFVAFPPNGPPTKGGRSDGLFDLANAGEAPANGNDDAFEVGHDVGGGETADLEAFGGWDCVAACVTHALLFSVVMGAVYLDRKMVFVRFEIQGVGAEGELAAEVASFGAERS